MASRAVSFVLAVVASLLVGGCGGTKNLTFRDRTRGIAFHYPAGWSVTGFSQTVSPARLVVASYKVRRSEVEGDCGGQRALVALPGDGAAALLIDYGSGAGNDFPPRTRRFLLEQFARGTYECFGDSYMLRFEAVGHDFQAYLRFGEDVGGAEHTRLLRILDSLTRADRT